MIHGSALVVVDWNFTENDDEWFVKWSSGCRTKLEFQNIFGFIGEVSNGGIVGVGGIHTDVVIGEDGFTICCGSHGCGDSQSHRCRWYNRRENNGAIRQ